MTIFWDHLEKINFCQKVVFFTLYYFEINCCAEIILKKLIFAQKIGFLALSCKLTISDKKSFFLYTHKKSQITYRKRTYLMESSLRVVFWLYLVNYQNFGQNNIIIRSPWINRFVLKNRCLILSRKLSTFWTK